MTESKIRDYLNAQLNNVLIDDILDPNNIQIHKKIDDHIDQNVHSCDELTEFKESVRYWLTLDNEIKDLSCKIKLLDQERKRRKLIMNSLNTRIMQYMSHNDIEELNSKEGRLKYHKRLVTEPITKKQIRTKLYESELGKDSVGQGILNNIFTERSKIKKETLKRLTHI